MASGDDPSSTSNERDQQIVSLVEQYLQRRRQDPDQREAFERELIESHPELSPQLAMQIRMAEVVFLATNPVAKEAAAEKTTKRSYGIRSDTMSRDHLIKIRCEHCGNKLNIVARGRTEISCPSCGSSIPVEPNLTRSDPMLHKPRFIGRFCVLSVLGKGAFGTAYRAIDSELSRTVAVKIPLSGTFQSEQERQRFLREARSAARLQHANIVQVYEVDLDGEIPYIVSELINGVSLADLISSRQLSCAESAKLMVDVSRAVDYAHRQGIIHRDIKPGNILLDNEHRPFIADFGLARDTSGEITMTIDGEVLGTPAYMSPEQARGEHTKMDFRSDIYSLGVVLYRLICGELPFRGSQRMMLHQVMYDDPKPPRRVNDHVPRDLETVVLKAMAKDRDKRYTSAGDFADDLQRWLNNESIWARPAGPVTRLVHWRRRHPTVAGLVVGLASLLLIIALLSAIWAVRERDLRAVAVDSKKKAEDSQRESTIRLADAHRQIGIRAMQMGDASRALTWFASALKIDAQSEDIQRLRIGLTKQNLPELRQLWTVPGQVTDIDVSSGGERVLVATDRGNVSVFEVDSTAASPLYVLEGDSHIRQANFSRDGSRIITVTGSSAAYLWDAADGRRIVKFEHAPQVMDAQFGPDSKLVATVGHDGFARIWNSEDGTLVNELKHPAEEIDFVRFSPDGLRVLTSGRRSFDSPSELTIWRLSDAAPEFEARQHSDYASAAEFNHDGTRFLAAGVDGTINVWDATAGGLISTIRDFDSIQTARFLADSNKILCVLGQGDVSVWGTDGRREESIRHPVACTDSAIESKGQLVAVAGIDGAVISYILNALEPICGPVLNGESVSAIRFAPDGRQFLVGGKNGVVRLWDLVGLASGKRILPHEGPVAKAAISPDGLMALTCSYDRTAQLWNVKTGLPIGKPMMHEAEIFDCGFSRDGKRIATASADKTARMWDAATGARLGPVLNHREPVNRLAFSPTDDSLVTATIDGLVSSWRYDEPEPKYTLNHSNVVGQIQFSPDGEAFATYSVDKSARYWRSADGESLRDPMRHGNSVLKSEFTPTGDRLATCATDNLVRIWNLKGGATPIEELTFSDWPTSVDFDQSGQRLLTSDFAGNTILWERQDDHFTRRIRFHESKYQLQHSEFHPQMEIVLASGMIEAAQHSARLGDGAVFLYDLTSQNPLSPPLLFCGGVERALFSPTGEHVIASSEDGTAKIWDLTVDPRPVAEIKDQGELLSGWMLNDHNQFVPVAASELRRKFEQSRTTVAPDAATEKASWRNLLQWLTKPRRPSVQDGLSPK